jgi:hypothetical protein
MLKMIDHIVVIARDVADASANYTRAGFTVTPGGEHTSGATHNALVCFGDGTYFELIAFKEPDQPQDHRWWERLQRGEGLIDYALLSDALDADAARVRQAGLEVRGPGDGGRLRPDGKRLVWRSFMLGAGAGGTGLPFVIEDVTPRELRVPGGAATKHANGATRVAGLTVLVADATAAASELTTLLGAEGQPVTGSGGEGKTYRFAIGRQWLEVIEPASAASAAGQRLARLGEGPYEVVLSGDAGAAPDSGQLLSGPLNGARIRLVLSS